jgi:hypothetical protein
MPSKPPPGQPYPLLFCATCGKVLPCPAEDALRYVKAGWPWCCGDVMQLYLPAFKPTTLRADG